LMLLMHHLRLEQSTRTKLTTEDYMKANVQHHSILKILFLRYYDAAI